MAADCKWLQVWSHAFKQPFQKQQDHKSNAHAHNSFGPVAVFYSATVV